MNPEETFVKNCIIKPRSLRESPLFILSDEHGMQARLDGYAVIPVEEYEKMIASQNVDCPASAEERDRMSLSNGQGGIDCINCGKVVAVTTRHDLEIVQQTLDWELGDPKCPSCGNHVTFEDYID